MPNFKRIGGGPWKSPDDLTWNDPIVYIDWVVSIVDIDWVISIVDIDLNWVISIVDIH